MTSPQNTARPGSCAAAAAASGPASPAASPREPAAASAPEAAEAGEQERWERKEMLDCALLVATSGTSGSSLALPGASPSPVRHWMPSTPGAEGMSTCSGCASSGPPGSSRPVAGSAWRGSTLTVQPLASPPGRCSRISRSSMGLGLRAPWPVSSLWKYSTYRCWLGMVTPLPSWVRRSAKSRSAACSAPPSWAPGGRLKTCGCWWCR